MSFDPIKYVYTPPPTVLPAPITAPVTSSGPSAGPSTSQASALIAQFAALADTSAYLQQVILNRCAGSGIKFTVEENPDLSAALGRIYNSVGTVPDGISVEMYSNMLDADIGLQQLNLALGNDAPQEASGYLHADLITATSAFESGMIASLDFQNNLTPLLRSLKGEQTVYANWMESLGQYPAARGAAIPATITTGVDVSAPVVQLYATFAGNQAEQYTRTFNLTTTPGHVEADINNVVTQLAAEPIVNLQRYTALFNGLTQMFHAVSLQGMASDMDNFMFISLLSQAGGLCNQLDRLFHSTVTPLNAQVSQVMNLVRGVQAVGNQVGKVTSGGLKGMVKGNACSKSPTSAGSTSASPRQGSVQQAWNKTFGGLTSGVNSLGSHILWAENSIDQKNQNVQDSLLRLMNRKTNNQNDRIQTLCSLQAVQSLTGLMQATIGARQNTTARTATGLLGAVVSILNNTGSKNGTSFAIQNGSAIAVPPSVPPIPPSVQKVFNAGGLGRLSF